MDTPQNLQNAEFDPKVKLYWYIQGIGLHLLLVAAVVGILTLPVWLVGGWWIVNERYNRLSATLTSRAVHLQKGFIYRVEKTIPLEKIQDLSMRAGPLLRALGLASIQIETAGGQNQATTSDMTLAGLINAKAFKTAVLTQRDLVSGHAALPVPAQTSEEGSQTVTLLTEIRDSLKQIELQLNER